VYGAPFRIVKAPGGRRITEPEREGSPAKLRREVGP
jgi:hypothetical protein